MSIKNPILQLYKKNKNIFTLDDLRIVWEESNSENLKSKVKYYIDGGDLFRISKGVYSISPDYNPKELITSLYQPSYISFETVLRENGVIFQHYDTIFAASYLSREMEIKNTKVVYRKLKQSLLINPEGIINNPGYAKASKERALLDTLYLKPEFYFDNLKGIDWAACRNLATIYDNQSLLDRLNILEQDAE